ncbi:hypothetical protein CEXT_336301 [Caerostris extrusa]|uniref:Uncharacterized protein n=1 Tax=Caerostris extrusa TaxID=172846 RepID=A0AAV4UZ24_CAEEX|nr:hypothetical protein CEXT_336301 [Caerostris extrusa]
MYYSLNCSKPYTDTRLGISQTIVPRNWHETRDDILKPSSSPPRSLLNPRVPDEVEKHFHTLILMMMERKNSTLSLKPNRKRLLLCSGCSICDVVATP